MMINYAPGRSLLFAACLLAGPRAAVAQGTQIQVSTRALDLEFSGRLQLQVQASSCTDATPEAGSACTAEAPGLDMFLRRARVSVEATIDDRLSFKLEPDFSDVDEVSLKDAWGRYALTSSLAIQGGHFKRPFDGFQLTSSSRLPFEQAVEVPGVAEETLPSYTGLTERAGISDRDIGMMLEGEAADGGFGYQLAVFTGGSESDGHDTNAGKQLVGRLRATLDAGGAPLDLTAAAALTDAPYTAASGETEAEYFANVELFAQLGGYGRDGWLAQAGVVFGDSPLSNPSGAPLDLAAGDDFASLLTWQGAAAYRIALNGADWLEAVAPVLRISYGDPNTTLDGDEAWGFTPGFTIYFYERNRLALTWDVADFAADGVDSEHVFRAQMQFHF